MDAVVAQKQVLLKAQRQRGTGEFGGETGRVSFPRDAHSSCFGSIPASLQAPSQALVNSFLAAITVNSTRGASSNRFSKYAAFCEAENVPTFPIVGDIVALQLHDLAGGDPDTGKAYDSHTTVSETARASKSLVEDVLSGRVASVFVRSSMLSGNTLYIFGKVERVARQLAVSLSVLQREYFAKKQRKSNAFLCFPIHHLLLADAPQFPLHTMRQ